MSYWLYIALFAAAVAVYAMVDILMTQISYNKKMVWFAIIVLLPIVGPMIYLFKKKSLAKS
mgnify:CR=1 FL=1